MSPEKPGTPWQVSSISSETESFKLSDFSLNLDNVETPQTSFPLFDLTDSLVNPDNSEIRQPSDSLVNPDNSENTQEIEEPVNTSESIFEETEVNTISREEIDDLQLSAFIVKEDTSIDFSEDLFAPIPIEIPFL